MNKTILTATLAALTVSTAPVAFPGEGGVEEKADTGTTTSEWKAAGVFTTSAVAGLAAAGPAGMIIGALGGAYLGEQVKKADQLDQSELQRAEYEMQLSQLKTQLANADVKVGKLSQLALDKLEFQVLFHTGADQLTERGQARVTALADFLREQDGLTVRLTGHADPRGTDEYNNVLSQHRALTIEQSLIEEGIEPYRIERRSFGSLQSTAMKGNHEHYAMERRVDIEIINPALASGVVQAH